MSIWLCLSSILIAEENENFLAVIERCDSTVDFKPVAGSILSGDKRQLLQLQGDIGSVNKIIADIKNSKLIALYASFNKKDLIFSGLPKNQVLYFKRTTSNLGLMPPTSQVNIIWSCKRLDGGLVIASNKDSMPGENIEVTGSAGKYAPADCK